MGQVKDEDDLDRLAREELLNDAKRAAARAEVGGAIFWAMPPIPKPNKLFFHNTVINAVGTSRRHARDDRHSKVHRSKKTQRPSNLKKDNSTRKGKHKSHKTHRSSKRHHSSKRPASRPGKRVHSDRRPK